MKKNDKGQWLLTCSVALAMQPIWAEQGSAVQTTLAPLTVQAPTSTTQTSLLGSDNASDVRVDRDTLEKRATTLGEALSSTPGIHSNSYGTGASAPIIRGQEGKRIKVLQNNADVVDMASLSPDHAIMLDPAMAQNIEVVRGPATLLYSSGSAAGLVNVIDNRIPSAMPDNAWSGEFGRRFNTNNDEDVLSAAFTVGLGRAVALHVEGLHKTSNDYQTPRYERVMGDTVQTFNHVPNTFANSQTGSLGLSWVGDRGYLGASVSRRRDHYGLPGHNHAYEDCQADVIYQSQLNFRKPYYKLYPFLANDSDIDYDNPGLTCHDHDVSHDDEHDYEHAAATIDLTLQRYDVRGELQQPVAGIDRIRLNASQADYHHDEMEGTEKSNFFDNQARVARLEISHAPLGHAGQLTGAWGIQYSRSENSGLSPQKYNTFTNPATNKTIITPRNQQPILHNNATTNRAIFAIERYQATPKLALELSGRIEQQQVKMEYDREAIKAIIGRSIFVDAVYNKTVNEAFGLLDPHQQTARSYAFGANWQLQPDYQLSVNLSHQERLPNAQELYAHGMHLATNSFEVGNRNLTKEQSSNLELALRHQGARLDYQIAAYLYDFKNYIYLLTLNDARNPRSMTSDEDLQVNRYMQSPARFYGLEGQIGYQVNPEWHVALYGDYVQGRLIDIPAIPGVADGKGNRPMINQPDRYTPRLPPLRLGSKVNAQLTEQLSAELDYQHVFEQDRLSRFERVTPGHDLLNIGLTYQTAVAQMDTRFFVQGNNLLDEPVYAHESFLSRIPQMGRNISIGMSARF